MLTIPGIHISWGDHEWCQPY